MHVETKVNLKFTNYCKCQQFGDISHLQNLRLHRNLIYEMLLTLTCLCNKRRETMVLELNPVRTIKYCTWNKIIIDSYVLGVLSRSRSRRGKGPVVRLWTTAAKRLPRCPSGLSCPPPRWHRKAQLRTTPFQNKNTSENPVLYRPGWLRCRHKLIKRQRYKLEKAD